MRRLLPAIILLSFAFPSWGQDVQVQNNAVRPDATPDTPAKAAAAETRRNQAQAKQLLTTAEGDARALEPPMRALTLMQIANALATLDNAKAAGVMHDAFVATTEMDPSKSSDKRFLQDRILEGLLSLAPDSVAELLPQAEPESRTRAMGRLIQRTVQQKNFAHGIELVNLLASESGSFPYNDVANLMMNLPPENAGDRNALFTQALTAYERDPNSGKFFGNAGFDRMIARFGPVLPQATVMTAVDEVLKRAKDSDQQANLNLSSAAGSAAFNSSYDYYLFELLPTIRHWDPSRADDLLKQNTQLQPVMQKFPNGVQSIDPSLRDTPPKPGESTGMRMSISTSDKKGSSGSSSNSGQLPSSDAAVQQLRSQLDAEVARILQGANKDPRGAIQRAEALPDPVAGVHPRIDALEGIANSCWKEHPAEARDALNALVKLATNLKLDDQRRYLVRAADLYVKADDNEGAKKAISAGIKVAEGLYEEDKNPDSPNEALKGFWPSTSAWSRFVMLAQKAAPDLAQEIMAGIKDDEIRTTVHIAYATALAGGAVPSTTVMVSRGNNSSISTGN